MATVVILGNREAALEAALELGHQVVLISDRKITKRRRATLAAAIEMDFSVANNRTFTQQCAAALRAYGLASAAHVHAVISATERAVLPAAWLRAHFDLPGNSAESAYLCRNKLAMKRRLRSCEIECAEFSPVTGKTTALGLIQRLGLPLVLKPVDSSGSRGATIARQQRDVEAALQPGMLAESFVHGIEMSVESFVQDGEVRFVNLTEYLVPLWSNIVPASVSEDTRLALLELNRNAVRALGLTRGMTHMEVFLTPNGPIFSEIAVRPPGGYLMELLGHAYGFKAWHAFINIELGQEVAFPARCQQSAGVILIHPGEGQVKRVAGVKQASELPGVLQTTCSVAVGETLTRRDASGESAAHIIASGKTRAAVISSLTRARRALIVELEPNAKPT